MKQRLSTTWRSQRHRFWLVLVLGLATVPVAGIASAKADVLPWPFQSDWSLPQPPMPTPSADSDKSASWSHSEYSEQHTQSSQGTMPDNTMAGEATAPTHSTGSMSSSSYSTVNGQVTQQSQEQWTYHDQAWRDTRGQLQGAGWYKDK